MIEVLEIDASVLLSGPGQRFVWPKFLPRIDAVILCYDAAKISSFRGMSELLENFAMANLSTVMLACKSEVHPKAVDPYYASDMASVYNVGLAECTVQSEEGKKRMRDCFSYLVKEVAKARSGKQRRSSSATSSSALPMQASKMRSASSQSSMSSNRARGDSGASSIGASVSSSGASYIQQDPGRVSGEAWSPLSQGLASRSGSISNEARSSSRKMSNATSVSETAMSASEDEAALQQSIDKAKLGLQSAKSAGGYVSIDELWNKLFYAAVSGNDDRFLLMFMVFYRGFTRPLDLLRQMISRFESLANSEASDRVMIRFSLMRLTAMLGDWVQDYPGDLSGPETYPLLLSFYTRLLQHPSTTHTASPLKASIESVATAPDLDALWANMAREAAPQLAGQDDSSEPPSRTNSDPTIPDRSLSERSAFLGTAMDPSHPGRHRSASDLTTSSAEISRSSSRPATSQATPTGTAGGAAVPGTWPPNSLDPQKAAERKAILRNVSNTLAEIDDEVIAAELTRLEWLHFTAIRPRDLLRHILIPRDQREGPVSRSIVHFNYISGWVTTMILAQGKTKARARMLEKFYNIAAILRHSNNYSTLQSVLGGLSKTAIHRLRNTRELLKGKPVIKTYLSLVRLMANERSNAAYRLALENSEGPTIPYVGVHLQDILSISDGNPSKRASDGMIHWRKFSLMDEAVMAIVKCQQYDRSLRPNPSVEKLIVGIPILDDEECYQRSLVVEPRSGNSAGGSKIAAGKLAGSKIKDLKTFLQA
ncbi:ras GEF [Violaceomyces palustris]|uniref:Ras GEF n=1 Tax=Violaceomyces palustris TaxID=1673888 RepID=A0ACD0NP90_9BASI|nr:ras GEF [Violaceomyces palustris]